MEPWNDKEFEKLSPNGAFVEPNGNNIDMKELRDYCRKNGIPYGELTKGDVEKFIRKEEVGKQSQGV